MDDTATSFGSLLLLLLLFFPLLQFNYMASIASQLRMIAAGEVLQPRLRGAVSEVKRP